jgi:hypothetical protein
MRKRDGEEAALEQRHSGIHSDRHYSGLALLAWDMSALTAFLHFILAALIADLVAIGFGKSDRLLTDGSFNVAVAMARTTLLTVTLAGFPVLIRAGSLGRFAFLRDDFAVKCHIQT